MKNRSRGGRGRTTESDRAHAVLDENFQSNAHLIARLFELDRKIASDYEAACALLEHSDVVNTVRFLAELDSLATSYNISPREIITLLESKNY